jgi:hypothetical protein
MTIEPATINKRVSRRICHFQDNSSKFDHCAAVFTTEADPNNPIYKWMTIIYKWRTIIYKWMTIIYKWRTSIYKWKTIIYKPKTLVGLGRSWHRFSNFFMMQRLADQAVQPGAVQRPPTTTSSRSRLASSRNRWTRKGSSDCKGCTDCTGCTGFAGRPGSGSGDRGPMPESSPSGGTAELCCCKTRKKQIWKAKLKRLRIGRLRLCSLPTYNSGTN